MQLIAHTTQKDPDTPGSRMIDHWQVAEDPDEAARIYQKLLDKPDLYSASRCHIIESTDYEPDPGVPRLLPDEKQAEDAGFASFNRCPHIAVEIPDGMTTITCRTSQGQKVTFSFIPYKEGGPPQCVDIMHHNGPTCPLDGRDMTIQRIIAFGKGCDIFRANPQATERKEAVTLTTLIISPQ